MLFAIYTACTQVLALESRNESMQENIYINIIKHKTLQHSVSELQPSEKSFDATVQMKSINQVSFALKKWIYKIDYGSRSMCHGRLHRPYDLHMSLHWKKTLRHQCGSCMFSTPAEKNFNSRGNLVEKTESFRFLECRCL